MIFLDSARLLRTGTDSETWKPLLRDFRSALSKHESDPSVQWRLLFMHHPMQSYGPHGGYDQWDDELQKITYVPQCDPDTNVVHYMLNSVIHEDLCATRYRAFIDSVKTAIAETGVQVQAIFSGHEHILQLYYSSDECPGCPRVHVISGAGSKISPVASPDGERLFTWPQNSERKKGESIYGFTPRDERMAS